MPRFFLEPGSVADGVAVIGGDLGRHLTGALRLRPGETLRAVADGVEHGLVIERIEAGAAHARIVWSRPASGETQRPVAVLQAICKEGMDEAVDALAELGAAEILPVITEHTVVRLSGDRAARRTVHWQAVAREAAQVAFRAEVPRVHEVRSLREALAALPSGTRVLACSLQEETVALAGLPFDQRRLAVVIGPEGGFGGDDIDALRAHGAEWVHLGPRVLRSRLAGAAALGVILGGAGELDPAPQGPPLSSDP